MKILSVLGILAAALLLFSYPVMASTDRGEEHESRLHLGAQGQLNEKACEVEGRAVINVSEKVKNDVDSGFAGNWAIDHYVRHIKVWKAQTLSANQWCAVVKYDGEFEAVAGQTGPGGTGIIGKDVEGDMRGGYRATFTADLKSVPTWPTHGFVGTVDYGCNIAGVCTNIVSWTAQYFDNVTDFAQPWWGWIYKAEDHHGTWLNQIDVLPAASGNIL